MRDWKRMDGYLASLYRDIYEQPEDGGHTALSRKFINWMNVFGCESVLDVGCGTGFCQPFFENRNIRYTGICLGEDYKVAQQLRHNVREMDYNFLEFDDESFDMIFSRHSLEHSPFPVLTLMEWHRVGRKYLGLVVPNPSNYTYVGRNHYSVSEPHQLVWWMRRAGWKLLHARFSKSEYWFVCQKMPIVSYEGWATAPLSGTIHEFERDIFIRDLEIHTEGIF